MKIALFIDTTLQTRSLLFSVSVYLNSVENRTSLVKS